jgi:hypothetical protein
MKKTLLYPILLTFLVAANCGCGSSKSRMGILSEKKMSELLIDTHLADAILFVDKSRADEKRDKGLFYYPSVLEKHGVTKAQMDSSVAYYMRNPAAYARIYDLVMKDLESKQASIKKPDEVDKE